MSSRRRDNKGMASDEVSYDILMRAIDMHMTD